MSVPYPTTVPAYMLKSTVVIPDAQIKTLHTVSVELIKAPGVGKIIIPFMATLHHRWFADYTNIDVAANLNIFNQSGSILASAFEASDNVVSGLLANADDGFAVCGLQQYLGNVVTTSAAQLSAPFDNLSVKFNINNHASLELTGGDARNRLVINIWYTILTLRD